MRIHRVKREKKTYNYSLPCVIITRFPVKIRCNGPYVLMAHDKLFEIDKGLYWHMVLPPGIIYLLALGRAYKDKSETTLVVTPDLNGVP